MVEIGVSENDMMSANKHLKVKIDKEGRRIVLIKPGEKLVIPQKGSGDGYKPRVESYTSNAKTQESSKQNLESQVKQLVSEVKKSDLPERDKKIPNSKIMPEDGFYAFLRTFTQFLTSKLQSKIIKLS